MKHKNLTSPRGFSILEVLVTIAILGVLAGLSYPAIKRIQSHSEEKALVSDVTTMNRAVAAYLGSGGSIPSSATGAQVIGKLKTKVAEEFRATVPGFSSSFIDPRITPEFLTSGERDSNRARAVWDPAKQKFYVTREKGKAGIKTFSLSQPASASDSAGERDNFALQSPGAGEEGERSFAFQFSNNGSWIWDYETDAIKEMPLAPSVFATTNVPVSINPPVSVMAPPAPPEASVPSSLALLDPPVFSLPSGSYPIQGFNMTVDLINPNPAGISDLVYSLDFGDWQYYPGGGIAVAPNSVLQARTVPNGPGYQGSPTRQANYGVIPGQLDAPLVALSDTQFPAFGTVSAGLANPNDASVSRLDYRINGGAWQTYSGPFVLNAADWPGGATIEAYAVATSAYWLNSNPQTGTIDPGAVQLLTPAITPSAPNFMAVAMETISVTVTNPNAIGSVLEYRLDGGAWTAYSGAFNVTRAAYPTGLTVEARARATLPSYIDSPNATSAIGLTPVTLLTPAITPSAPNFMAGSVETISVTVTNPNATGSALDYRLNGGAWTAYSGAFNVTRAAYPTGLNVEARARSTSPAYSDSANSSATIGLTPATLLTPAITPSAPNFIPGSVETISVTVTNPNATGSALDYRLNGGAWTAYLGAFNVTLAAYPTGLTVEARARSTSAAYSDSANATATIGLAPGTLLTPAITTSEPNFMAGSVETISVTVTDPNAIGSALDYRLNGGAWTAYTGVFNVTRAAYPTGLTVEARARATSSSYTNSANAMATIGLTPVQLLEPTITRSAPNFFAGVVETITVTIANPNTTGSALDYRLNGGAWIAYSAAFNVTRATYPTGLTVEARARATNAAYSDSPNASTTIGVGVSQLQPPGITPSAPNFMAGTVNTITVTLTNPNPSGSSTLRYRLNGGSWTNYSSPFNLNRTTYPTGVLVEAYARTNNAAYTDSANASVNIGLTPVQLLVPTISPAVDAFTRGSVTSINVTLSNPNSTGSALDYRLNGGAWIAYSGRFTVTLATYPSGVVVEARARATAPAYLNSNNASTTLGVLEALMTKLVNADFDTCVAGSLPNFNFDVDQLYTQSFENSRSMIYFNLADDITGPVRIRTATLYTTVTAGGAPAGFPVYGILPGLNWTGGGITWNSAGNGLQTDGVELDAAPTSTSVLTTTIPGLSGTANRRSWNVTALAQRWVNNSAANNGVAIFPTAGGGEVYCSSEHPLDILKPKLYIEWNPITYP